MLSDFYGRKSSKDEGRSVASQEAEWRADCTEQNFKPGRAFADPDKSASRYAKQPRPDFEALVEHIRSGQCEMLTIWECSRGSRKLGEWIEFLDLCLEQKTLIRVLNDERTYDMSKDSDYSTLATAGVKSRSESEIISKRTLRGKRAAAVAEGGGRPAGKLVYGFLREYDERGNFLRQYEHPEQGPVVREIVSLVAAPVPLREIARRLNTRGFTTAQGHAWTAEQVRDTAINPGYAGLRVDRGVIVGPACWEPIVDVAEWKIAHALLTDPKRRKGNDPRLANWLTGAVSCGVCDKPLHSAKRGTGVRIYRCLSCLRCSASAAGMEGVVKEALLARMRLIDAKELFLPRVDDEALRLAEKEETDLRKHLQEHYDLPPGQLSAAGLAAIEAKLLPQIAEAEAKVKRLSLPPVLAELADVDVVAEWDNLAIHVRRDLARTLATLILAPAVSTPPRFDRRRLGHSRWAGDDLTWAAHWSQ